MTIPDDLKALVEMIEHNTVVRQNLSMISMAIEARAIVHDLSKFSLDEFESFVELKKIARTHPYGSVEYDLSMKNNQAITLHFARNTHHPEHHHNGVVDMSLLDMIEMVCDWKATNEVRLRKNETAISWEESMELQRKRFSLTDNQLWLIDLIHRELQ